MGKRAVCLSMTGFGRASLEVGGVGIVCEVRTLNSKGLDIHIKAPSIYFEAESDIRKVLSDFFERGRVTVSLYRAIKSDSASIENAAVRGELVKFYFNKLLKVSSSFFKADDQFKRQLFLAVAQRGEVYASADYEILSLREREAVLRGVKRAGREALKAREEEGRKLFKYIDKWMEDLGQKVRALKQLAPKVAKENASLLKQRLRDAGVAQSSEDRARIIQEVSIMLLKLDVAEEINRLESHLKFYNKQKARKIEGRATDFLLHEILRELNTLSAKSNSAQLSRIVMEAKRAATRVREQIQNVE